ncbi:MAG TPA: ADYC domain-containing protein [Kofleriaceae bacterium]|nr:ADYC domain-containing protein [Kofleriaceae bacterium]
MMLSTRTILASLVASLAAACSLVDEGADPPELAEDPIAVVTCTQNLTGDGCQQQGRHILGAGLDDLAGLDADHHFSVSALWTDSSNATHTVTLNGGASLDPATAPSGILLAGSDGRNLQVTLVSQDVEVSTYSLLLVDPITQEETDPCDGGVAVPLIGSYTRKGVHEDTADRLTFACDDGVDKKCIDWLYVPGTDPNSLPTWKVHQACTFMARADYCKVGHSFTREETPIQIFDLLPDNRFPTPPEEFEGVDSWPPPPDQFYMEAAWTADGTPFCFTKARWQAFPKGGPEECAGTLPDPREDATPYCEDYDWNEDGLHPENSRGIALPPKGSPRRPLLVNTSLYNDLAMHIWQRGNDYVSTVRGYDDNGRAGSPTAPEPPFSGIGWTEIGLDGFLLRSLPGSVEEEETANVFIYRKKSGAGAGDRVLGPEETRLPWPFNSADYASEGIEGMVFRAHRGGTVPLYLYSDGTRFLSTTGDPPVTIPAYTKYWNDPIGWVAKPIK